MSHSLQNPSVTSAQPTSLLPGKPTAVLPNQKPDTPAPLADQPIPTTAAQPTSLSDTRAQSPPLPPDINGNPEAQLLPANPALGPIVSPDQPKLSQPTQTVAAGPQIQSLLASRNPVPGLGYPIRLTVVVSGNPTLAPTAFSWSSLNNQGHFNQTHGPSVIWTAPLNPGGPYTLQVQVSDGVHPTVSHSLEVAVQSGNSQIYLENQSNQ